MFPNHTCAADKTNKSKIFQDSIYIIGMACKIQVSKKEISGKHIIQASIPIAHFFSQNRGRDKYVRKFLEETKNTNITFNRELLSSNELAKLVQYKGGKEIDVPPKSDPV